MKNWFVPPPRGFVPPRHCFVPSARQQRLESPRLGSGSSIESVVIAATWLEETDIDCCTGQTQHGYFYLCPDGIYHTVTAIGDTNCS